MLVSRIRRLRPLVLALGVLGCGASAKAALIPYFVSQTASGNVEQYNYSVAFMTAPSGSGADETLTSGSYFTLYDIPDLLSSDDQGADFTVRSSFTGLTPSGTSPTDSPALYNVTFTYAGPTVTTAETISGIQINLLNDTATHVGTFTSQDTRAPGSLLAGSNVSSIGSIILPGAVPEPVCTALLSLGAMTLLRRRRASGLLAR